MIRLRGLLACYGFEGFAIAVVVVLSCIWAGSIVSTDVHGLPLDLGNCPTCGEHNLTSDHEGRVYCLSCRVSKLAETERANASRLASGGGLK
jgi:hypothetical protein